MATQGSSSNPAEFAFAWDGVYNQFATKMVVPTVGSGVVEITKVGCWLAGYLSSTSHRLCVWDNDANKSLLGKSASFTPTVRSFTNGASDSYNKDLQTHVIENSGAKIWVGFAYNSNGQTQFDTTDNTGSAYDEISHQREKSTTWPSAMDSPNKNSNWRLAVWFTYNELITDPNAFTRRSGNWNTKPEWKVRRSAAWVGIEGDLWVRRSGAWHRVD